MTLRRERCSRMVALLEAARNAASRLSVAPFDLQAQIIALIDKQTERARRGDAARILAEMNSLVDPATIRALYAPARRAWRSIFWVRGICCLRAGVSGLSERIRVVSVDHFLDTRR